MYEIRKTDVFENWFKALVDIRAKDRIQARIFRAANGNFGDWKTESGDIRAMRIDYGPGYRLYYVIRKRKIIFLLCGGDKRNQAADIAKAEELVKEV